MSILEYIIIFTFLGSIVSLIGGIILLSYENFALKVSHLLISFAAGVLLGTAFFDLLPEATLDGRDDIHLWTLAGILSFFLLERFIHWSHTKTELHVHEIEPTVSLILIGDTIHNFLDGVVIAASFLVSIPLGIITAIAVGAHEIPQEIGDFSILLHKRVKRTKIIIFNILSAATAIFGAVLTFYIRETLEMLLPVVLSLTAGFFIYIASSDLIPEIHHEKRKGYSIYETVLLLTGVLSTYFVIKLLNNVL